MKLKYFLEDATNNLLNESGIKMPKGTKAAKIIYHRDMDGLFSAIITFNQLVKQGINPNNITTASIQYGEKDYQLARKMGASKGQMVALVDFAGISDDSLKKIKNPDFWSDHHIGDNETKKEIISLNRTLKQTTDDTERSEILNQINQLKKEEKEKIESELKDKVEKIFKKLEEKYPGNPYNKKKAYKIAIRNKKAGTLGASDFKSEADHLATNHTSNMVDQKTLQALNIIDSAGYSDIDDLINVPTEVEKFMEKGLVERNAILSQILLTSGGILNDDVIMDSIIREVKPSINSVYGALIRYSKINDIKKQMIKELSKPRPDWERINKARKLVGDKIGKTIISKNHKVYDRLRELGENVNEDSLDDYERFNELKSKGLSRTSEEEEEFRRLSQSIFDKTRINKSKKVRTMQNKFNKSKIKDSLDWIGGDSEKKVYAKGKSLVQRENTDRYIWTQIKDSGVSFPFVIKAYGPMIQISINPKLPEEIKDQIDLEEIGQIALEKVKNKPRRPGSKFPRSFVKRIIEKKITTGGHKGIYNIGGLQYFGYIADWDVSQELQGFKNKERRIKNLKNLGAGKLSPEDQEKLDKITTTLEKIKTLERYSEFRGQPRTQSFLDKKDELIRNKMEELGLTQEDIDKKDEYIKKEKILNPTLKKITSPEKDLRKSTLEIVSEREKGRQRALTNEIIQTISDEIEERYGFVPFVEDKSVKNEIQKRI